MGSDDEYFPVEYTRAVTDIMLERMRQVRPADQFGEGYTREDDDKQYTHGELAQAAACFALAAVDPDMFREVITNTFPWDMKWLKREPARRILVKAGALIVAELERIDRMEKEKANAST